MNEKILRWETVKVGETEVKEDQYGEFLWFNNERGDTEHKIKAKRKHLWNAIQPGVFVKLGFASFNNNEYIASATQVAPTIEEAAKAEGGEVVKTETARPARSTSTNDSIESQVAFKGAVELIVADKLDIKGEIGEKVRKWISERI